MASHGEAFAPGHITAFFVGYDDVNPFRKGSRGAGLCTTLGIHTVARAREDRAQSIEVYINDEPAKAESSERAARLLLGSAQYEVKILQKQQLPVSQGFGMSGAGALSTVLALDEALGLGRKRDDLVGLAHRSDVEGGTGLGDVMPQSVGGMDLRVKPGAPPYGLVKKFEVDTELMLCAIGPTMAKASVLGNPRTMERIREVGLKCLDEFERSPSLNSLFDLGRTFAFETGLASPKVRECIDAVRAYGSASMSMLGNAVFAVGSEIAATVLRAYGTMYRCRVDNEGARVV